MGRDREIGRVDGDHGNPGKEDFEKVPVPYFSFSPTITAPWPSRSPSLVLLLHCIHSRQGDQNNLRGWIRPILPYVKPSDCFPSHLELTQRFLTLASKIWAFFDSLTSSLARSPGFADSGTLALLVFRHSGVFGTFALLTVLFLEKPFFQTLASLDFSFLLRYQLKCYILRDLPQPPV